MKSTNFIQVAKILDNLNMHQFVSAVGEYKIQRISKTFDQ